MKRKRKKTKCEKCGTTVRAEVLKRTYRHPCGCLTVLGRHVRMEVDLTYFLCPKCGEATCTQIALPLDPDAEVVRQVFDMEEPLEELYAFLRSRHVTADDLLRLREAKGRKLKRKDIE